MTLKSHAKTHKRLIDLYCEFELRNLTNTKIGATRDHGKNYKEVRLPLVHHLQYDHQLFRCYVVATSVSLQSEISFKSPNNDAFI